MARRAVPRGARQGADARRRGQDRAIAALERRSRTGVKTALRRAIRARDARELQLAGASMEANLEAELIASAQRSWRGWARALRGIGKAGPEPSVEDFRRVVARGLAGKTWRERLQGHGLTLQESQAALAAGELPDGPSRRVQARVVALARTEAARLDNAMRDQVSRAVARDAGEKVIAWKYVHYSTFVPAYRKRGRPVHIKRDGLVFEVGTRRFRLPGGPHCFLPGTQVSGRFVAGLRALYDGEVVEILCDSGRRITTTPNHPVATMSGFRAAREIDVGAQLITEPFGVERQAPSGQVAKENAPAAIEEVFRALARDGRRLSSVVADDLHGDAARVHGEIEVVWSDRSLLDDGAREHPAIPELREHSENQSLIMADTLAKPLDSQRPGSLGMRGGSTEKSRRGPRGPALALSGGAIHGGPLEPRCLGHAADVDARLSHVAGEDAAADAKFLLELLRRHPALVQPDRVVEIKHRSWSGHVYDLQTEGGWLLADGVLASNCKCIYLPIVG